MSGITSSVRGQKMVAAPRRIVGYRVPAGATREDREKLREARRLAALARPTFDHRAERRGHR